eukprot:703629-Alexandrium_andersonii.AAC.1
MQREEESKAAKVAGNYRQHVLSARSLVQRIEANAEWTWARGDANVGELKRLLDEMDTVLKGSAFLMDYVTMEAKDVRKAYGAKFVELVKSVRNKLGDPTDQLSVVCQRLNKMHKAFLDQ